MSSLVSTMVCTPTNGQWTPEESSQSKRSWIWLVSGRTLLVCGADAQSLFNVNIFMYVGVLTLSRTVSHFVVREVTIAYTFLAVRLPLCFLLCTFSQIKLTYRFCISQTKQWLPEHSTPTRPTHSCAQSHFTQFYPGLSYFLIILGARLFSPLHIVLLRNLLIIFISHRVKNPHPDFGCTEASLHIANEIHTRNDHNGFQESLTRTKAQAMLHSNKMCSNSSFSTHSSIFVMMLIPVLQPCLHFWSKYRMMNEVLSHVIHKANLRNKINDMQHHDATSGLHTNGPSKASSSVPSFQ